MRLKGIVFTIYWEQWEQGTLNALISYTYGVPTVFPVFPLRRWILPAERLPDAIGGLRGRLPPWARAADPGREWERARRCRCAGKLAMIRAAAERTIVSVTQDAGGSSPLTPASSRFHTREFTKGEQRTFFLPRSRRSPNQSDDILPRRKFPLPGFRGPSTIRASGLPPHGLLEQWPYAFRRKIRAAGFCCVAWNQKSKPKDSPLRFANEAFQPLLLRSPCCQISGCSCPSWLWKSLAGLRANWIFKSRGRRPAESLLTPTRLPPD